MFIRTRYSGYNRHGEQCAAGLFLILMEPKNDTGRYPTVSGICSDCGRDRQAHDAPLPEDVQVIADKLHRVWHGIFKARTVQDSECLRDAVEVILDAKRRVEGCRYFRPSAVSYPIKAIVRHTTFSQLGNWIMGRARVHGHKLILSGSYGGDGLTCTVPDEVYSDYGMELPEELRQAWANGGGWNSAGSEAPKMREWALQNLKELRR